MFAADEKRVLPQRTASADQTDAILPAAGKGNRSSVKLKIYDTMRLCDGQRSGIVVVEGCVQVARIVKCPAGQWTVIFDHVFVQIPRSWTVTFAAADGGPISGEVLEKRSSWIFRNPAVSMPLSANMTFHRGWWNTFYSVRVKPTQDVVARIG